MITVTRGYRNVHATTLGPPLVEGGVRKPYLEAQVPDQHSGFRLLQGSCFVLRGICSSSYPPFFMIDGLSTFSWYGVQTAG